MNVKYGTGIQNRKIWSCICMHGNIRYVLHVKFHLRPFNHWIHESVTAAETKTQLHITSAHCNRTRLFVMPLTLSVCPLIKFKFEFPSITSQRVLCTLSATVVEYYFGHSSSFFSNYIWKREEKNTLRERGQPKGGSYNNNPELLENLIKISLNAKILFVGSVLLFVDFKWFSTLK